MLKRSLLAALAVTLICLSGSPETRAAQDDPRLDNLFDQLHQSSDAGEIMLIESYIWALWSEAYDEELNRLMRGGILAMNSGNTDEALGLFNHLIDLAPEFAEAWNKRATVYFMVGRYEESIADCLEVLALEPRHFGALSGLGLIHNSMSDKPAALFWFREALKQNPHMENIQTRVEELSREVEGEAI